MTKLCEFDPYASFVTHNDGRFYKSDLKLSRDSWELDTQPEAVHRLWSLGRRALLELAHLDHSNRITKFPDDFTREEFEKYSEFYEKFSDDLIESPRVLRRLLNLRNWSHDEYTKDPQAKIFAGTA